MASPIRYVPPKPAPLPADFDEFYGSLTDMEKQLHDLAIQLLGSSYFPQWTPMYTKWAKKKAEAQKAAAQKAAEATQGS